MADYTELVKNLRITERICRDRMDGQVMLDAADAIEHLQSECREWYKAYMELLPTRWYSVEECTPKEDETVLTWGKQGVILLDWLHDNKWCCFGEVTHWMPLPEPPKEETE